MLHEPERLFVGPRVPQSIGERKRGVDLYPHVFDLLRERQRPITLRMLLCTCPSCACAIASISPYKASVARVEGEVLYAAAHP
jgi:hypothetical protein